MFWLVNIVITIIYIRNWVTDFRSIILFKIYNKFIRDIIGYDWVYFFKGKLRMIFCYSLGQLMCGRVQIYIQGLGFQFLVLVLLKKNFFFNLVVFIIIKN